MTEAPGGRRAYDPTVTTDHDLLVRIDERLNTHLVAYLAFLQQYAQTAAATDARLASLERARSEDEGADQANARTVALIVAASSGLTALATWVLQHFVR